MIRNAGKRGDGNITIKQMWLKYQKVLFWGCFFFSRGAAAGMLALFDMRLLSVAATQSL